MIEVYNYFNHTWGYVELAGTIASLICVYLATKQNIWTWFWGALGVALFGPLFYHYNLYSDAGLQILFFLPLQYIGYRYWKSNGPTDNKPVNIMSVSSFAWIAYFILILAYWNGLYMELNTDASYPYWDALTTWISIFASVLMLKKYLESWTLWITMDIIAIPIYYSKELYVVSGLYTIFLGLAIYGYYSWHKELKAN